MIACYLVWLHKGPHLGAPSSVKGLALSAATIADQDDSKRREQLMEQKKMWEEKIAIIRGHIKETGDESIQIENEIQEMIDQELPNGEELRYHGAAVDTLEERFEKGQKLIKVQEDLTNWLPRYLRSLDDLAESIIKDLITVERDLAILNPQSPRATALVEKTKAFVKTDTGRVVETRRKIKASLAKLESASDSGGNKMASSGTGPSPNKPASEDTHSADASTMKASQINEHHASAEQPEVTWR
ncbi:hypothetical protein CKM354_001206900 [Cercospora kikuchii]|uniref:Uncharacterized protein n=1 Tax=Cercospora kikuchii TaxID=84275 RepID=A0A9P3CU92_9PEZI|nr:uncharacterized protein CKM354_001206900 [Cercospora kikuchii]GIZ49028.1 hypothetical protein CKM354_001206900 [Cercospora kikuchii]